MADERLIVKLMSVNWTHSRLNVCVDCHHLHQLSIEADNRPEPQGNVKGVCTSSDERKVCEVVGDEKCTAGCNREE
jgi:ribosome-binding protein aMBF1 (putative translation factor)